MWREVMTAGWLVALSAMDVRKKSVPLWLLGVGAAGTAAVLLTGKLGGSMDGWQLCRSMFPGAVFLAAAAATGKAGCGDGIVLLMLGLVSGSEVCLFALMAGLFLTALFSGTMLALRKVKRSTRIPFLPFLTAGWGIITVGKAGVL